MRFPGSGGTPQEAPARPAEMSWETSRLALAARSEARAWFAAGMAASVSIVLVGAIAMMVPLKEKVPYVIEVDSSTGMTTLLSLADDSAVPASEMMDKHWLNEYVLAREGYDYHTLEREYVKVRELSTADSFEAYARQFSPEGGSVQDAWRDGRRIAAVIHSIILGPKGVAAIRFTRRCTDAVTGEVREETSWTATVAYGYYPNYRDVESLRLVNPFGFRVISYRLDPELR